jgi:hypothetical protein
VDFRNAHHLPKVGAGGPADPKGLPRQRRGITPQMHGRFPDYDVLEQAPHWDEATRRVVLGRVRNVPEIVFFDAAEVETATTFADLVLAQDTDPRIPVIAYVDEKLAAGRGDGYRYFDMPDDRQTWRLVVRGLDEEARRLGAARFALLRYRDQLELCDRFSEGRLHGGTWAQVNVVRAWSVVMRYLLEAFYAHPWAWNEIGFGGPAYPRGYARFGSPHLDGAERESWEGAEAFELDPVEDVRLRGLE